MKHTLIWSREATDHLCELTARQRRMVVDAADAQLTHQPFVETRNRKKLRKNKIASWELRVGILRVLYDVGEEDESSVLILAVGVKQGSIVYIAGDAIEWEHEDD